MQFYKLLAWCLIYIFLFFRVPNLRTILPSDWAREHRRLSMRTSAWRQLLLLLWKNWLLQFRKKTTTVVEICLPLVLTFIVYIINKEVRKCDKSSTSPYRSRCLFETFLPRFMPAYIWANFEVKKIPLVSEWGEVDDDYEESFYKPMLAYTPNNTAVKRLMATIAQNLQVSLTGE